METSRFEQVETVARALLARGSHLGRWHSVGTYRTQDTTPGAHSWAVLNLQGMPVVLAHDAFEAATWFLMAEAGQVVGGDAGPLPLHSDAELAEMARQERLLEWGWLFEQLSRKPVPPAPRLRGPGEAGYDKRCAPCAAAEPHTNREHMKSLAAALAGAVTSKRSS
jgi:hypothetical protein